MKKFKLLPLAVCLLATTSALQSCSDFDDDKNELLVPSAAVTVKPQNNGESFTMQLDKNTILQPTNMKASPFGNKEVRALVNYTESAGNETEGLRNVTINWIDSIRTKKTVPDLGEENNAKYGNDPIEIVNDWLTVAEDGYLTLRFRTLWGYGTTKHNINLLTNGNPDNPYELELRHDANGDLGGEMGDALIAFNLKDLTILDMADIKIKIKWKSFSGEKSAEFDLYIPESRNIAPASQPTYSRYVN